MLSSNFNISLFILATESMGQIKWQTDTIQFVFKKQAEDFDKKLCTPGSYLGK